jgi:uncharacterized membrane protein
MKAPRRSETQEAPTSAALGLERIVFFSDAVMAIAITLLAIDLRVPEIAAPGAAAELPRRLAEMTPRIMSFVISFAVVGIYWTSHHRYFGYIKRYDAGLIWLNMLFLLCIAFMPFFANVLGQYAYLPLGVSIYAAGVAATGLAIGALWWYASYRHRLVDANLDAEFIRTRNRVALVTPALFLVSIPFALVRPAWGIAVWWVSPLLGLATLRVSQRRWPRDH